MFLVSDLVIHPLGASFSPLKQNFLKHVGEGVQTVCRPEAVLGSAMLLPQGPVGLMNQVVAPAEGDRGQALPGGQQPVFLPDCSCVVSGAGASPAVTLCVSHVREVTAMHSRATA